MSENRRKRGSSLPGGRGGRSDRGARTGDGAPPHNRPRPQGGQAAKGRGPKARQRGPGGGAYWLYGRHAGLAALANPARHFDKAMLSPAFQEANAEALARAGAGTRFPVETLEPSRIDRLLGEGAVHQGLALAARPLDVPDVGELRAADDDAVVLVLDQASDPRNVGAAIRAATAFSALAVVTTERGAPPESGALAKAAAGALETTPYIQATNLARAIAALKENGFWAVGLDGEAETAIADAPFDRPTAIVMGAEGRGLRRLTGEVCDALVHIPISPGIESLNVSAAAAIALYERRRGR